MGLTNVGEQVLLNRLFCSDTAGTVNLQLDGSVIVKLALYTSTGTLTNALLDAMTNSTTNAANYITQVDPNASNYVAQTVTFSSNVDTASGPVEDLTEPTNSCDLDAIAEFTVSATGTWGTVTHYGIHIEASDVAPTAATCVFVGEWATAAVVNAGDTVQVAAGAVGLKITAS
ncbi:MAG TPA: hypothetical protein EYQ05_02775 [Gammaproteobacteria bacterium]|nr:hypothetical protein [Gammaproteobacteria bacterium]